MGLLGLWFEALLGIFLVLNPDPPPRSLSRSRGALANQNSHRWDRRGHDGHRRLGDAPDQQLQGFAAISRRYERKF